MRAAAEMIQLHGAIGITWEHPAHRYLKRAHGALQLFGVRLRPSTPRPLPRASSTADQPAQWNIGPVITGTMGHRTGAGAAHTTRVMID